MCVCMCVRTAGAVTVAHSHQGRERLELASARHVHNPLHLNHPHREALRQEVLCERAKECERASVCVCMCACVRYNARASERVCACMCVCVCETAGAVPICPQPPRQRTTRACLRSSCRIERPSAKRSCVCVGHDRYGPEQCVRVVRVGTERQPSSRMICASDAGPTRDWPGPDRPTIRPAQGHVHSYTTDTHNRGKEKDSTHRSTNWVNEPRHWVQ